MRWAMACAAFGLCSSLAGPALAANSPKTPQAIEQQYNQEKSAKKRAGLARELLGDRMEELHALIQSGVLLKQSAPQVHNYLSAADRLDTSVRQANNTGISKESEIFLRSQLRELRDLKMDVSVAEQKVLDSVIQHVSRMHDQMLYSVLIPGEESTQR